MNKKILTIIFMLCLSMVLLPTWASYALDPPTSLDNTVTTNEDQDYIFKSSDFPFDDGLEGNSFVSVRIVSLPLEGELIKDGITVSEGQLITVAELDNGALIYTPEANGAGIDYASFVFNVMDNGLLGNFSGDYTITIDVTAINDPPTASSITLNLNEDASLVLKAADFGFADPDVGDALSKIQVESTVAAGTLTNDGIAVADGGEVTLADLNADNLIFTPAANANGVGYASFTFKVFDGSSAESDTKTITFNVDAINDPPTASSITLNLNEDASLVLKAADFSFTDPDVGDALSKIQVVSTVAAGTLTNSGTEVLNGGEVTLAELNAGNLIFTPAANESGTDYAFFTFKVFDGSDAESEIRTITFDVTAINDPPTASDKTLTLDEDASLVLKVADFSFADPDVGDALSKIQVVSTVAAGTLTNDGIAVADGGEVTLADLNADKLIFTPAANANGLGYASFTFKVFDGSSAESDTKTITFNVDAINDPPTSNSKTLEVTEDNSLTFAIQDFVFNDVDGDVFTKIQITKLPANGSLKLNNVAVSLNQQIPTASIPQLVFTPPSNQYGIGYANFEFKVSDPTVFSLASYIITINVLPVNDPPTTNNSVVSMIEDASYVIKTIDFVFNDTEGDAFQKILVVTTVGKGTLKNDNVNITNGTEILVSDIDDEKLVFVPVENENGVPYTTFTFKVIDDQGGQSANRTFTFNVTPVNDAPTASDKIINLTEDATYSLMPADFGFVDVEDANFTKIRIDQSVTIGTLKNGAVTLANGAEVAFNDVNTGKLIFAPATNGNGSPYANFTFTAFDSNNTGTASKKITFNVSSVNDLPTSANKTIEILEDHTNLFVANDFVFNDPDAGSFTKLQIVKLPNKGSLKLGIAEVSLNQEIQVPNITQLEFIPADDENGTPYTSFDFKVNDGTDYSAVAYSITVNVTSVNDEPTIGAITDQTTPEDVPLVLDLTLISPGPNESGQTLTITATSANTAIIGNGVVSYIQGNSTGKVTFTPVLDATGVANITLTVKDDGGTSDGGDDTKTISFRIAVGGSNDPPTLNDIPDPLAINEDAGEQSVNLSGISDGDPEEVQPLTITATSSNTKLIDAINVIYGGGSTAILKYTPKADTSGESTITVRVFDGFLSVLKSFKAKVNPVNDPPTLNPIANPADILEDAGEQKIILTGLTAGPNESQGLNISAKSSNEALVSNFFATYTAASATGVLSYTTNANQFGTAEITITIDDGAASNNTVSQKFTMKVNPVADQPRVSNAFTNPGVQTNNGLVIDRNQSDGIEVTHFKIIDIKAGKLYYNDGSTQITNGTFISYSAGNAGLKFTPTADGDGSFSIQASLSANDAGLGGGLATALIILNNIPTTSGLPNLTINEDSPKIVFDLYNVFDDVEDIDADLKFEVSNTDPGIVSAVIAGRELTLNSVKDANGAAIITVKCTDTRGATVEAQMTLTITPVNDAPVFTSTPVVTGVQGVEYIYQIETSDVEGDNRGFDWIAPEWLFLVDNGDGTAILSGTPEEKDVNSYNIEIIVQESTGNAKATQAFILTIANVNDPPTFVSTPPTEVFETKKYEYTIEVADSDLNDSYTMQISPNKPDWLIFSNQAPYKLEGFAPVGSAGNYPITLFAIDQGGLTAVQSFTINVIAPNILPIVKNLPDITIEEDQVYTFNRTEFKNAFSDGDAKDTLVSIIFTELPANGNLMLGGMEINANDSIGVNDINEIIFVPDQDFNGINFFNWNGYDGRDYAIVDARGLINISPVDDAPEITNLEEDAIIYNFGDYDAKITENAVVKEVDIDRIVWGKATITQNYLDNQDSLYVSSFDGVTTVWNDTTGTLTFTGIKKASVYQDIFRSLTYINQKRILPNSQTRTVELIVHDGELASEPVSRDIQFIDSFVELVIPSGFTPNQDMVNDTWEIDNIKEQSDAIVRVYSRDGNMLYESTGTYKEWDGTYQGAILRPGVYYYTIEILKYERKYSGSITLLR